MQVQRPDKSHLKYQVPEGWDVVDLGQVFSLEYGLGLTESKREPGKYPVFGSNGIIGYHSQPLTCGPGIIVGRKGSIGETAWSESDFWPIDTTYYINLKNPTTSMKWLYYLLSYLRLENLNSATGIPELNRNEVYSLKYAVPTQQEQHKIAYILSKVDELIQKMNEVIEQTQRLKKGVMQRLFTKGNQAYF